MKCLRPYLAFFSLCLSTHAHSAELSLAQIGAKIWQNEGAGKVEYLTTWNQGEAFASFGIGHFIWYPTEQKGPYQESFPALLNYFKTQNIPLPSWLQNATQCPWPNRRAFYQAFPGDKLSTLRHLLQRTVAAQTRFILQRQQQGLLKIVHTISNAATRQRVTRQIQRLQKTPLGQYVLMDYINFKGEGINHKERYQTHGWGLKQVLEQMPDQDHDVLAHFIQAADSVLTRRVHLAPKDESRWLPGWRKRLRTYAP